jgi:glutamate-1-semialdehyde 2,1-aminomutase
MLSEDLYRKAIKVIPAGVTRSMRFFDPYPFYAHKAYGSKLVDVEGKTYSDYWMGHGALVLGHMHPAITEAFKEQLQLGFHFGVCHEWEVKLSEQVAKLVPSVQMIAFCNSGNESNMHAIRLARAYTKRKKIGKFEGHFHGILESLYVGISGPLNKPESAGQDTLASKNTAVLPYDDPMATYKTIKRKKLASVSIEVVTGGTAYPVDKEFLKGLREVCDDTDTLLIFDEAITGFRLAPGGAQQAFGVTPDITVFGKAIAGGEIPVGAVGGRADIMELMDHRKHPTHSHVVRGGTYAGNPLAMRAGYEATRVYEKGELYTHIDRLGQKLIEGLEGAVENGHANARVTGYGSMSKLHFLKGKVRTFNLKSLMIHADQETEKKYFHYLISNEIFALPDSMVHFYVSMAHSEEDIEKLVHTTEDFLKSVRYT